MTVIPTATVLKVRNKYAHVRCPYCHGEHEHSAGTNPFIPGSTHHRAPGCGLHMSGEQRAAGYRFTIPN